MSTRAVGTSTFNFIKSTSVVPPAMNFESADAAFTAAGTASTFVYPNACIGVPSRTWKRCIASALPPRLLHGCHDVRVRAAPANVAAHAFAHRVIIRSARFFQQRCGRHHLPGGAIAALKAIVFKKCRLHGMQLPTLLQPFDGRDLVALMHDGEREARVHAPSVHMHGARAALPVVATLLGSEEMYVLANCIEKRDARFKPQAVLAPIDSENHGHGFNRRWSCGCRRNRPLLGMRVRFFGPGADRAGHPGHAPAKKRTPGNSRSRLSSGALPIALSRCGCVFGRCRRRGRVLVLVMGWIVFRQGVASRNPESSGVGDR